jgi:HAD superfamily hydrolase (TIGR01509 family)
VQVLTLDFHNTIANCDPWFDLEVRDLPWAVIERLGLVSPGLSRSEIDASYRQLRHEVIASGIEVDAYEGAARVLAAASLRPAYADLISTIDTLMRECLVAIEPVPGAVETITHLHALGVTMGVVSSAVHHHTLTWTLERLGILDCFATVVTSASSGHYKSNPAIYQHAIDTMGGTAPDSVHIGDSLRWDVETAQMAGMHGVWLKTSRKAVFAIDPDPPVSPSLVLESMVGASGPILALLERLRVPSHA